ncbi:hypothetical protein CR513_24879, partial [Mucuna pruriens]
MAMQWLSGLPARTIRTFGDLVILFISHFATNKAKQLEVVNLFNIKQVKGEILKGYLARGYEWGSSAPERSGPTIPQAKIKILREVVQRP